jgi:hypothetical protein
MRSLMRTQRHPSSAMDGPQPTRVPRPVARCAAVLSVLVGASTFFAPAALAAAPETPTTGAASAITANSATLNGTLNPIQSATAGYHFTYGKYGTCQETPTTPGPEATGQNIKVSTPVTGLEGNTEYMVCVVATNPEGETPGVAVPFTTLVAKPIAEGGEPYGVTPFAASAYTFVNPEHQTTSCVFEYGETLPSLEQVPCQPASLEGEEAQSVAGSFADLKSGTTYHYRVVVKNATGETVGVPGEFTTLVAEAPAVEGEGTVAVAVDVTSTSAKIEAQINPHYQETSYGVEYATNATLEHATTVTSKTELPPESSNQPISLTLSLQPRTTYYYRVIAHNGTGPTAGAIQGPITTLATPIVTTGAAQLVTRTTAEVSGTVNPGALPTSAHIAFISQEGYEANGGASAADPYAGGRATSNVSVGSEPTEYTADSLDATQLSELKPGTTYDYAVVATNPVGTTIGRPNMTFTTSAPTPPTALTGEASGVTQTSATLTGLVDTEGLPTSVYFEFGDTPALGVPEWASISPSSEPGNTAAFSLSFSGLQPGTTYYYRATASSTDGSSQGAVKSFTTASFPAPPTVSSLPLLTVPLNGLTTTTPTKVTAPKKPKPSTKAKKLAKALKACAKKPKSKRAACKRQAHKKYGK